MDEYYVGSSLTIWLCAGAQETWNCAEQHVPQNKSACLAQFRARIGHLADSGRLRCPDHMNSEGDGIFVVKATCGLRAWGWFDSHNGRRAYFISHVVLKRGMRAGAADLARATEARRQFKEQQR
jgi:hypothetical protein